jgi:hypothetical protein
LVAKAKSAFQFFTGLIVTSLFRAFSVINTPTMICSDVPHPLRISVMVLAMGLALWLRPASTALAANPPKPPAAATPAPATASKPTAAHPATAPTTAPAPAPKAVALALAAALAKPDPAAAKALFAPADKDAARWVDATVSLITSLKRLDKAAATRFGEAGKVISQQQLHFLDAPARLAQAQEKIEGDTATLTLPGAPHPLMRLKRQGGAWQPVVQSLVDGQDLTATLALDRRLVHATDRTTDEIATGVYPTPDAAARIFTARVLEARMQTP